jgi:hypothetical protein
MFSTSYGRGGAAFEDREASETLLLLSTNNQDLGKSINNVPIKLQADKK